MNLKKVFVKSQSYKRHKRKSERMLSAWSKAEQSQPCAICGKPSYSNICLSCMEREINSHNRTNERRETHK
jgi:hypothetical protein